MTVRGKCLSTSSSVARALGQGVQNLERAAQCFVTTGGVKWRKLGIFINSALAHLEGTTCALVCVTPCLTGRGTTAGWNVLPAGHTSPHDWSGFILVSLAGGTGSLAPACLNCFLACFFGGSISRTLKTPSLSSSKIVAALSLVFFALSVGEPLLKEEVKGLDEKLRMENRGSQTFGHPCSERLFMTKTI